MRQLYPVLRLILNKDKLIELQTRELKDVENFINLLPYYGNDVSLEKYRPNKEKYPVGRGHEPLIKIELGHFSQKIEAKIKSNPELMKRLKGTNDKEGNSGDDQKADNDYNHEFSSDTSTSLANIFNSKSVMYIRFTSGIFFLLIIAVISLEFIFTFLNIGNIKTQIGNMYKSYKLLDNIAYTKYFITEAILANEIENYVILSKNSAKNISFIDNIKSELAWYRQEFSDINGEFSSSSQDSFSKNYQKYIKLIIYLHIFLE